MGDGGRRSVSSIDRSTGTAGDGRPGQGRAGQAGSINRSIHRSTEPTDRQASRPQAGLRINRSTDGPTTDRQESKQAGIHFPGGQTGGRTHSPPPPPPPNHHHHPALHGRTGGGSNHRLDHSIDRPTDRQESRHPRHWRTGGWTHRLWPVSRFSMTVEKTMRPKGSKASRRAADCVRNDRFPTKSL